MFLKVHIHQPAYLFWRLYRLELCPGFFGLLTYQGLWKEASWVPGNYRTLVIWGHGPEYGSYCWWMSFRLPYSEDTERAIEKTQQKHVIHMSTNGTGMLCSCRQWKKKHEQNPVDRDASRKTLIKLDRHYGSIVLQFYCSRNSKSLDGHC